MKAEILHLPKMTDPRGNLTFIENSKHIPFDVKRVFYIYDVPAGESRGAHAHKTLHQFLICLSGSFEVETVSTNEQKTLFTLNRPWMGLHIPPLVWASEINFSPGSVCLVLTSDFYDSQDYIRDYEEYKKIIGS